MKLVYDQGVFTKDDLDWYLCRLEGATAKSKLNFVFTFERHKGIVTIWCETKVPVFDSWDDMMAYIHKLVKERR